MIRTTVFYNFNDTEIIIIMLYYLNNILIVSYYRKWSKRLWFDYTRFFSNIYIVIVEFLSKSILLRGVFRTQPSKMELFCENFLYVKKRLDKLPKCFEAVPFWVVFWKYFFIFSQRRTFVALFLYRRSISTMGFCSKDFLIGFLYIILL